MARAYRTDIDGLRAIAILGVVLYHAGLKSMSGGYAGVDVFFVISGYLIGGNILDGLARGDFSFRRFYLRRVRRILPALVVMVLAVMLLGWFTLMPHVYRYTGGAAFSALLSLSNIWFLFTIDYFRPEAAEDPLVHTWSLGVEEQFYLIVPLMLVLLWRWGSGARLIAPALIALIAASFFVAVATSAEYRMQAFYLLHTRAWELLIGVAIAVAERRRPLPIALHAPAYVLGLILVLIGLWSVPPKAPWPGFWTLPAVLGSALILAAPHAPKWLQTPLTVAPMRFLGLISYSFYLWHQPAFSLLKSALLWPETLAGIALVLAGVIAVSALSWRFVEQPFRRPGPVPRPRRLALTGAAALVVVIALGGHISRGYPSRMPPEVMALLDMRLSASRDYKRCMYSRPQVPDFKAESACVLGNGGVIAAPEDAATARPEIALWGDSHGARLAGPLAAELARDGLRTRQFTLSSCLPVPGLIIPGQTRASQCPAFNDKVMTYLAAHPEISHVVLFATWKNYLFDISGPDMTGHSREDGFFAIPQQASPPPSGAAIRSAITDHLARQLHSLTRGARRVTLVMPVPRPDIDIPLLFGTRAWWGTPPPRDAGYPRAVYDVLGRDMKAVFTEAIALADAPAGAITLIDPAEIFCDAQSCALIRDGQLLYTDGNHPSPPGLALFVPEIAGSVRTGRHQTRATP